MLPASRKAVLSLLLFASSALTGQAATANRIVSGITSESRTKLANTVPPRARLAADLGAADPALTLNAMTLRFNLSDANQAALTELLLEQQQPGSANFHKWLTPEQFGTRFGLSAGDLAKVTSWLSSQGFTVTGLARSGTFVTFSGTAAQVERAFATTIHQVTVDGELHYSNLSDPALPSGLANVVASVGGLHDFKLHSRARVRTVPAPDSTGPHPEFTSSLSGNHFIAPGDFYTIYDETALLNSSINGSGITIAVMGQTDISLSDVAAFRAASGLSPNVPAVRVFGQDPGTSSNDVDEAQLDVEWSGAAAPSANILYVNSRDAVGTSLTQAIDNNLAPIMTISYGDCEANFGAASLTSYNLLFQQANAQGITIVGPSGDSGAADCDYQVTSARKGLAVDYPASSPYVTGVGGTMFNEGSGTYWAATNGTYSGSALSYIPEAVWNETAADTAANNGVPADISASGGGASAFFAKPSWQVGIGVPADSFRDVPDLSLNASASHDGYLICSRGSCVNGYRANNAQQTLDVIGGTSVGTPSFAGLLALVEQKIEARIGNANPTLYALANSAYANAVFHDVTSGSNTVPCTAGTPNCASGGSIGYNASTGYDLATGWGSIDAFNLINDWPLPISSSDFSVAGSTSTLTVAAGGSGAVTYTLTSLNNFAGNVTLSVNNVSALNAGVTFSLSPVTLTAGGTGTSVLTVRAYTASAGTTASPVTLSSRSSFGTTSMAAFRLGGGGIAFASAMLFLLPRRRRSLRSAGTLLLGLLSFGLIATTGCSSSGSTATPPTTTAINSAKGTYLLSITATSGTITRVTNLTVVVQ